MSELGLTEEAEVAPSPSAGRKQVAPKRSHPAQSGETFDGPPTLERSGSEHRVGRFTSFLLRFLSPTRGTEGVVKTIEKAWLEVELPLERETEGFEKILL